MKLFACIPTYNESANIAAITAVIDAGLQAAQREFDLTEVLIVNADSASTDDTVQRFAATATASAKHGLVQSRPGKGRNLLAFIGYADAQGADLCVTIDADIVSAGPEWVTNLVRPLVQGSADFVTPLYERSRFEGSTTIHFAYPLVQATTGQSIRQPIGGDFAWNRRFMSTVRQTTPPAPAYHYGIDIFLTYLAASQGLTVAQVELGQKRHAPSFDKLEGMFPEVALTAANLIRSFPANRQAQSPAVPRVGIMAASNPTAPDKVARMRDRAAALLAEFPAQWTANGRTECVTSDDWTKLLTDWCRAVQSAPAADLPGLTRQLLPYFMLRAITFWRAVADLPAAEVEAAIDRQAEDFSIRLASTARRSQPAAKASK